MCFPVTACEVLAWQMQQVVPSVACIYQHVHVIFPLTQKDAPRRTEDAHDRSTECELGSFSVL